MFRKFHITIRSVANNDKITKISEGEGEMEAGKINK